MPYKEIRTVKSGGGHTRIKTSYEWVAENPFKTIDEVLNKHKEKKLMNTNEYINKMHNIFGVIATRRYQLETEYEKAVKLYDDVLRSPLATPLERNQANERKSALKEEYNAELASIRQTANNNVDGLKTAFNHHVNSIYRLDGSKLDMEDLALINSGIKLDSADINALATKHKDNTTMLRRINDYANEHGIRCKLAMVGASKISENDVRNAFSSCELLIDRIVNERTDKALVWADLKNGNADRFFLDIKKSVNEVSVGADNKDIAEYLEEKSNIANESDGV